MLKQSMHFSSLCDKKFYYAEWGILDCFLDFWLLPGP
jgi:hypothetical protein